MNALFFSIASSLWLGILTSISPCPLATNIAAISFIGRRVESTRHVIFSGLSYAFGRMITYLAIGIFVVTGILSIPYISNFLQQYMNKLLGPILIITGLFLLEFLQFTLSGSLVNNKIQKQAEKGSFLSAGILGIAFSLSFCPVSAALFFGSLIPLAVKYQSRVLLPSLYGLGTALPVIIFALLIALSARSVGTFFNRLTQIEWWTRRLNGLTFIIVGIYYSLKYIFQYCSKDIVNYDRK